LLFFTGFYGNYTRQIPPVVAAVLFFSLVESKLILPSHLKHVRTHRTNLGRFARFQKAIADGLESFVEKIYRPALVFTTRNRYLTLAVFGAMGLVCLGIIQSGRMGFVNMPSIDRNKIIASLKMPRDTPVEITERHVRRIEEAIKSLRDEFRDPGTGQSLIGDIMTSSGGWSGSNYFDSRRGFVTVNILDPGQRSVPGPRNAEIAKRWKDKVGKIPGAEHFRIWGDRGGGFHDDNELESIEIELRGEDSEKKAKVIDEIERLLESYPGIEAAWTNYGRSRDELVIKIRPEGEALGLTQRDLARQVRAAFFGEQAQRIQRGRDDIRVMVRLPRKLRESLDTLEQLRIRTPNGGLAPFRSVAEARFEKAPAEIKRIDGAEVSYVYAQPKDETIDIIAISKDLSPRISALVSHDPGLSWRYQGYIAEHKETKKRIVIGAGALLLALFALLAIPFRSIVQPFYVLIVIPFGVIGALLGHWILDLTPSYLSVFGMLALAGVVVNDSLVMVDFINQHRRAGDPLFDSLIGSGTRRFRPILLTSLTTFAGLVPLIFDPSRQGQFLIPMAVSLAFGILFATFITLFLVPATYHVGEDIRSQIRRSWHWFVRPWTARE
jgi:multidrug efflux pump subunit AcrB